MTVPIFIELFSSEQALRALPQLIKLLQDAVDSGASIGFLPPLSDEEASLYWNAVIEDIVNQKRVLLVARDAETIVGAVQLEFAAKANALHRAEVQKLLVFQQHRQRGIGRSLMLALEDVACAQSRTLLVLDTRQGDVASKLYRNVGYNEAGVIPSFARNTMGTLDATVYFYKVLLGDPQDA